VRNATSLALERISSGNLFYKTVSHYWLALAPDSQGHQYSHRRRASHILIDWPVSHHRRRFDRPAGSFERADFGMQLLLIATGLRP
jgi:hypothetical protein